GELELEESLPKFLQGREIQAEPEIIVEAIPTVIESEVET
ncbi:unnamed protein product, partial [marine sediment metagenome]